MPGCAGGVGTDGGDGEGGGSDGDGGLGDAGGCGGISGGKAGKGGDGVGQRGPQSLQSLPNSHFDDTERGPPSLHVPSSRQNFLAPIQSEVQMQPGRLSEDADFSTTTAHMIAAYITLRI